MFSHKPWFRHITHVFPPLVLLGPLIRFLATQGCPYMIVVPDLRPRKYWWLIIISSCIVLFKLGSKGERDILLVPTCSSSSMEPEHFNGIYGLSVFAQFDRNIHTSYCFGFLYCIGYLFFYKSFQAHLSLHFFSLSLVLRKCSTHLETCLLVPWLLSH